MTPTTFAELGLSSPLLQAITDLGFEKPSPIQARAIPAVHEGKDIVGLSQTGSGKTAAFTLPALEQVNLDIRKPQVLILSPTRELCVQVCEEARKLATHLEGIRATPIYGGAPIDRQIRALHTAQIVVGTPGRLQDHLRRKTLDTSNIKLIILDEADRMLDMGFREDMEAILSQVPKQRQILFFSATMNRRVEELIKRFGNQPETISIDRKNKTVDNIAQSYYEVRQRSKVEVLSRILDTTELRLSVIFCNTKRSVDECTEALLARGYTADRLHGDIGQQQRERTIKRFRDGDIELLVATDVAARGLDIDEVDAVFNYDIPQDPEDYVHRIGRTGRAGRKGIAASFVFGRDIYRLQNIERYTRQKIAYQPIPSQDEVEGKRADLFFEKIKTRLESDTSDTSYQHQVDRLLDQGHTATDIACSLFATLREELGREGEEIYEDSPKAARTDYSERKTRANNKERFEQRRERRRSKRSLDREQERRRDPKLKPGQTQLFIGLGSKLGVKPGEVAGMIYSECKIGQGSLGKIRMFPKHCLVQVQEADADNICRRLKTAKLRGKSFPTYRDRDL